MGILDEAIRAHLDLKRRQGAADEELKRLEDEAFGPPTRPGEPDFPDRESDEESQGNGAGAASATEQAEDETTAVADEAAAVADETEPVAPTTPEEPPPVEPPPVEEPPAEEPPPVEAQAEAPPAEEQTAFYDQTQESGLDVGDLELEFDEEVAEPGAPAPPPETREEPPIESLDTVEHEPPIESLDTVEHHIEELPDEPAERTPEPSEPAEEPEATTAAEEEGSEDVLEETPEFLRDAPEDDELWFEQGEPKDFDFDD